MANGDTLTARALGYFSIGLGLAQVAAPAAVAELIGIRGKGRVSQTLMRMLGMRELAAGAGLLTQPRPVGWLWARVAGDAMDLALLGGAMLSNQNQRQRLSAVLAAVSGVTVADWQAARQLGQTNGSNRLTRAVTINRSPADVYQFWRDFRNFPRFMTNLESVTPLGDRQSHWRVAGGSGRTIEWDAEIITDHPNELIVWRSSLGADVDNHGTVRLTPGPGGQGTEVRLEMSHSAPAVQMGDTLARMVGRPPQQVQPDFRKLKELLETGHVVRSSATSERSLVS